MGDGSHSSATSAHPACEAADSTPEAAHADTADTAAHVDCNLAESYAASFSHSAAGTKAKTAAAQTDMYHTARTMPALKSAPPDTAVPTGAAIADQPDLATHLPRL